MLSIFLLKQIVFYIIMKEFELTIHELIEHILLNLPHELTIVYQSLLF